MPHVRCIKASFIARQTVIYWAPTVELVLTGSSSNGSLLGWDLSPLKQSAKIWLHDAGITQVHELVSGDIELRRLNTAHHAELKIVSILDGAVELFSCS